MTAMLSDASSVFTEKLLSQHQSLLMLIQQRLDDPTKSSLAWLDIACGQGQILRQLSENLAADARQRLRYFGFDIDAKSLATASATARAAQVSVDTKVGTVGDLYSLLPSDRTFDLITCTNSVHELEPAVFARALVDSIARLSEDGMLFFYDMEEILPVELGALPWKRPEVESLVSSVLTTFGVSGYNPQPGLWRHTSTTAWNLLLQRRHLSVAASQISERLEVVRVAAAAKAEDIMRARLSNARALLQSCTTERTEKQDDAMIVKTLYEFWALSRHFGGAQ